MATRKSPKRQRATAKTTAPPTALEAHRADAPRGVVACDREQSDAALRASEERYRRLFTEMASGCCLCEIVCDASGTPVDYVTLEVNAEFERIMGVGRDAVVGRKASAFMGREELDLWLGIFGPVALTGASSARLESFSVVNQKTFEGNAFCPEPGRFAVTFTDVTERVRTRRVLEARLRLLEFAAAHTPDELLVATLDECEALTDSRAGFYHFLLPDQRTLALQAWSTRSALGSCKAEGRVRHCDVADAGVWADCVRQRRPVIHNDYAALPHRKGLPEGHATVGRVLAVPVVRADRIVAILGVGNKATPYGDSDVEITTLLADVAWDIAERQRAETEKAALQAELIEMQKLESVGRLAAGVAHDFNNTLQTILLNAELALGEVQDPDARRHLLDLKAGTERSADLTAQLLAFARQQRARPQVLDLNGAVATAVPLLQQLVGAAIAIEFAPDHGADCVRIDPSQLQQVLAHLAENARQAIAGSGRITIATAGVLLDGAFCAGRADLVPGEYVRLTFGDDGAGMTRDVQMHLFEPFFTSWHFGERAGLGLSAVYGIVRQNGGAIEVASEPGRGTTFTIWLPRSAEDAGASRAA
jgi:two-component system, cell cycle sensor histidine kinase and response regulator CckA